MPRPISKTVHTIIAFSGLLAGGGSQTYPAVSRPMILVPAIVAWQIGMTSCSSASKTLCNHPSALAMFPKSFYGYVSRKGICEVLVWGVERGQEALPVEVLAGAHGYKSIGIRQGCKDSDSVEGWVSLVAQSRAGWVGYGIVYSMEGQGTYSLEFSNCARTAMMVDGSWFRLFLEGEVKEGVKLLLSSKRGRERERGSCVV